MATEEVQSLRPGAQKFHIEEIQTALRVLEAIVAERTLLGSLPEELRRSFVMAAGRVSRPHKLETTKLAKLYRRAKRKKERAVDRKSIDATALRESRENEVFVAPAPTLALEAGQREARKLLHPVNCYVCKAEYTDLHFFYDAMCQACGDRSFHKRFQTAPMHGRIALVTGARVKIGYQTALFLLRAGARVLATTRFPHDGASRFAREKDYDEWRDRLEIHGLDLRHTPSVELFCDYLLEAQPHLDAIVNNAAQTVRRPPGYYKHLLPWESAHHAELPTEIRSTLRAQEAWKTKSISSGSKSDPNWVSELASKGGAIGLLAPAILSQVAYDEGDAAQGTTAFPVGERDADLQQIDLRENNSWRMRLADVPTPELLEVHLVNAIAPFLICSRLKPLMLRSPHKEKHIINASAMEGKFARYTKTDKHPHTNMAKAALNMMTLTSARDYVTDNIFMNAVDTGWVTDEDPAQFASRKKTELGFQPPLDIVDGAARLVDPIFHGLNTGEHIWGKFLKDYAPTEW